MEEKITVTPLDNNAKVIPVQTQSATVLTEKMTIEEFMQTDIFKNTVAEIASRTGKNPVEVAGSMLNGLLTTVSDTGVRAVSTFENFINNLTDTAASAVKGVNKTVCDLAKDTVRTMTLGKGNLK